MECHRSLDFSGITGLVHAITDSRENDRLAMESRIWVRVFGRHCLKTIKLVLRPVIIVRPSLVMEQFLFWSTFPLQKFPVVIPPKSCNSARGAGPDVLALVRRPRRVRPSQDGAKHSWSPGVSGRLSLFSIVGWGYGESARVLQHRWAFGSHRKLPCAPVVECWDWGFSPKRGCVSVLFSDCRRYHRRRSHHTVWIGFSSTRRKGGY